jgi:hypothetical protein
MLPPESSTDHSLLENVGVGYDLEPEDPEELVPVLGR